LKTQQQGVAFFGTPVVFRSMSGLVPTDVVALTMRPPDPEWIL
jgi:hypothetical protein